jgi:hypothetical protein
MLAAIMLLFRDSVLNPCFKKSKCGVDVRDDYVGGGTWTMCPFGGQKVARFISNENCLSPLKSRIE